MTLGAFHYSCAALLGRKKARGVASIEFAGSVMVVVLLMLVVAELGRVFYSYTILTQSVRSGARYMSENSRSPANVLSFEAADISAAKNLMISGSTAGGNPVLPGFSIDDIVISADYPSGATKDYVNVAATYNYQPLFSAIPNYWSGGSFDFAMTLNADNTMRSIK